MSTSFCSLVEVVASLQSSCTLSDFQDSANCRAPPYESNLDKNTQRFQSILLDATN